MNEDKKDGIVTNGTYPWSSVTATLKLCDFNFTGNLDSEHISGHP